ncbi:hypothetical protein GON26_09065 [Flavobacterium sp. GA093]|uniref:Uncharacterized protein n=1 Tax=Flavobacterium hydrocarbonoxydans TaxID=2683249 RepID=A0A6I4NKH3_9FLAO|nr:hypothetical protein [Flavobacterium hydrocarbonoxydans]MWB94513.1 hypothetical protein [Flavobacterium hydrocarbonoxydans]
MRVKNSLKGNRSKIVLVNYADKNYTKSQKINTKSAIKIGCFEEVISFSPNDIDECFYNKNKNILDKKRGNGYWLWKPYFIKKALQNIKEGELLFYCDSGSYFLNSINELLESTEKNQDIIPFELQQIEKNGQKEIVLY